MKSIAVLSQKILAGVAGLVAFGCLSQAIAQPAQLSAKVIAISGAARYSTDSKNWQMLHTGDVLPPGAVVQTAEKSSVDLQLGGGATLSSGPTPNGAATGMIPSFGSVGNPPNPSTKAATEDNAANLVRVGQSSVLAVDKLTSEDTGAGAVEDTQLDLRAGEIFFNVKKMSAASKFEIKIPNGVAGIRGTKGHLTSAGNADMLVGSIIIAIAGANQEIITKLIRAGESFNAFQALVSQISPEVLAELQIIFNQFAPEGHGHGHYTGPWCINPRSPDDGGHD